MNVLIADDTYIHMAMIGYILSHEIPTENLETKVAGDGG